MSNDKKEIFDKISKELSELSSDELRSLVDKHSHGEIAKLLTDVELEDCDHSDIDEGFCLICDEDLTEELSAQAYDRYKDYMKYGE